MKKLILFNMITLDGFFAGPNGEIDWHRVDEEFNEFAIEQLDSAGGLVFGRLTYELMASYWPTSAAGNDDPLVAGRMNALPKIVVSRTLTSAPWNNTRLVKEKVAEEFTQLKQQPGADWYVFGSANLAAGLTRLSLLDEYRLIVNPIILGRGLPLFQGVQQPLQMKLIRTRTFQNGNVLLVYQP